MLKQYWNSFFSLFFPKLCAACDITLLAQEDLICTSCSFHLPYIKFDKISDQRVEKKLWGKIQFTTAHALLDMSNSERVKTIIQKIKYQNQPYIAQQLGFKLGQKLKHVLPHVDYIIPIPLHPKKQKERGYNQSYFFARGLSLSMQVPIHTKILIRTIHSISQTKKSRTERYTNIQNAFQCVEHNLIKEKHLLVVDDVITTGSTMVSAGQELIDKGGCSISFVAIATA